MLELSDSNELSTYSLCRSILKGIFSRKPRVKATSAVKWARWCNIAHFWSDGASAVDNNSFWKSPKPRPFSSRESRRQHLTASQTQYTTNQRHSPSTGTKRIQAGWVQRAYYKDVDSFVFILFYRYHYIIVHNIYIYVRCYLYSGYSDVIPIWRRV